MFWAPPSDPLTGEGETQITERNDNKDFINPLKVDLTIIGS